MKEQHIAVFTPLVGGHVSPALGVCSELAQRGHRVTYPTDESFAARIRKAGATPILFQPPQLSHVEKISEDAMTDDATFWRWFTAIVGPMSLATAASAAAQLADFYEKDPPDVVLYDWFAFAGRIVARSAGCPAIQVHTHFAHRESLMRLAPASTTPAPLNAFATLLDAFLATFGFEGSRHLWHYEPLNIFLVPRSFQYDADAFDDRFQFVGATHNRKPPLGVWRNRAAPGQPVVLISEATSGTDGAFLKLCLEALAQTKYHVVVSKAANTPEIPAASLPSNFEINRDVLNGEILPHAQVMLCQGGMGTTLDSLYRGVPVVALPLHPFNAEVAYRMAELGLGLHVDPKGLTAQGLREAVDAAVSDHAMRERVKHLQAELALTPGPAGAADAIEAHLRDAPTLRR